MNETDDVINKEKNSAKSIINIPNYHLNVALLTTNDDDIKILPKSNITEEIKSEITTHIDILSYTYDIILSENKVDEYIHYIRYNYYLHKLIFNKDYERTKNLLECNFE